MSDKLEEIHKEALEFYDESVSFDVEERGKSVDDVRYLNMDDCQWDDYTKSVRRDRPMYHIDKISLPMNQLKGDYKQNRAEPKIIAVDGAGNAKVAEVMGSLIRTIQNEPKARFAKDKAAECMFEAGFGAWRVITEEDPNDPFIQNIKVLPILDPWYSVWRDPFAEDLNGRDDNGTILERELSKRAFERRFPDKAASDIQAPMNRRGDNRSNRWFGRDTVRVAEYWRRTMEPDTVYLMNDGRVIRKSKAGDVLDELSNQGILVVKEKKVKFPLVRMYKMSGIEILEEPSEWMGMTIPIITVYGYITHINNCRYYRGMVRKAKDPSRIYDYATSANIEAIAASPKDPVYVTPEQISGHESMYENFNSNNSPFMLYNPDPEAPGPPQRGGAPAVQAGLIQQIQQADFDIQATTGRFSPSLGDNPKDQSGRAVIAQQKQGDLGTFSLVDNMWSGITFEGEIIMDLIPKIYDTERLERIIKADGTTELVAINQTVIDEQTNRPVVVNDLSVGRYNLTIDISPSFKSQRQEQLNLLEAMSRTSPEIALLSSDLKARVTDFAFSDELQKRLRKLLIKQGAITATEEEKQELDNEVNPEDLERQKIINQMQAELLKKQMESLSLKNAREAAEIDKLNTDNDKVKAEISKIIAQTQSENADAGLGKSDEQKLNDLQLIKELLQEQEAQVPQQGSTVPVNGAQ